MLILSYSTLLAIFCTAIYIGARARSISFITMISVLFIQLGIRPIFIIFELDTLYPENFFAVKFDTVLKTNIIVSLYLALLTGFYLLLQTSFLRLRLVSSAISVRIPYNNRPFLASLILTTISILIFTYVVMSYGSYANVVSASKISRDLSGSFIFLMISVIASAFCLVSIFLYNNEIRNNKIKVAFLILMIAINFTIIFAWGNRYFIAMTMLSAMLSYHYGVKKINFLTAVLSVLSLVILFQILKFIRWEMITSSIRSDASLNESFWRSLSTSFHMVYYDALSLALQDAGDKFDFRSGQDFINGIKAVAPRFLFPERESFHIGTWFVQVYYPARINGWPVSTIGSWFVNFGYFGIPLGALLSATATSIVDKIFSTKNARPAALALGAIITSLVIGGGIDTSFAIRAIYIAIPLVSIYYFTTQRSYI